jgi:hypothetical protein
MSEINFIKCIDIDEVGHIFYGIKKEDVLLYNKIIDADTFVPAVQIIIKNGNTPLFKCFKYEISMDIISGTDMMYYIKDLL